MPIKIILNGYYRSGTTFLWETIKNHLHGYKSAYEPLNSDLPWSMRLEKDTGKYFSLHQKPLWEFFYKDLSWEQQTQILLNHPNSDFEGIKNENSLLYYFDLIESFFPNENIYLQTNRLHFFLASMNKQYDCKLIHIIRNPVFVFQSIYEAFYKGKHNSNIKKLFKLLTGEFSLGYAFEINKEFFWIHKKLGYPFFFKKSLIRRNFHNFYNFEKFVVNWIISNFYAIKEIENTGGIVLFYEDFIYNKFKAFDNLNNYLNINIDINNVTVNLPKKIKHHQIIKNRFLKAIKNNRLEKEYLYITSKFTENCKEYPSL